MITREFDLMLYQEGNLLFINANQYDSGEQWIFTLYEENGVKYTPATGAIVGVKSDGKGIINTGTVDEYGRVVINETQQMTAAAGLATFELLIDNDTHGTANFKVDVEPRPADNADLSDSDLSLIQEAIDSAEVIVEVIGDSDPSEVIGEHVDAWLDNHPEATTTVEDGAITSAKLNDSVKTGVFEDMTVGTSLAVMNDEGQTDNLAYKFRPTGGDAVRELDEIHGGTIAWNQRAGVDGFLTSRASVVNTSDNTLKFEVTSSSSTIKFAYIPLVIGHKYLLTGAIVSAESTVNVFDGVWRGVANNDYIERHLLDASSDTAIDMMLTTEEANTYFRLQFSTSTAQGDSFTIQNMQFFDLTAMFGSTVADAIYAMEQSSAGAGVAYFRSLFPNSYYAYNSGELVSVEGLSAHETVGFNQWDEEIRNGYYTTLGNFTANASYIANKNPIPVIGGATYYFKCDTNFGRVCFYDSNMTNISANVFNSKNTTLSAPANACYMNFDMSSAYGSTYKNNICINLSSSLNGTYKPYQKHTYPLDSTLTLRGVPKWSNGLYFDGDIYRHDGSVSRRYGTRAYQSGDESLADAITDGTNTVYKLTTPTAETADPYQQYQICDGKGTEEYISETVTPVGHSTFYPVDIVSKVNKLPSDFSTLIAPTEEGFKATRNYTAKQFLIINNQLYRVTANIANGANIVPNTNVTAVTIADILTTLI